MNLKHIAVITLIACMTLPATAAGKKKKEKTEPEGYIFTTVKENPVTPIKNQSSSGTCWSFSFLSFIESEILKAGGPEVDLSEMFVVHHTYQKRAEKYVRLHGKLNFGAGSCFTNALGIVKEYGMVPEEIMKGLNYGSDIHRHGELDALLQAYVDVIVSNPNNKLSTAWEKGYDGILNAYLGEAPERFSFQSKEYTPEKYAASLKIDLDDYVDLCSWSHIPFYEETVITVPDNWMWGKSYNIPIDDLIAIIDNALEQGYTVAWASDVSEKGFTRKGLGIVPDYEKLKTQQKEEGSDQTRWIGKSDVKVEDVALLAPCEELVITQEMRQEGYDTYQTTDDHGMHIYGIAHDQTGKKYYIVKNSWGEAGDHKGIWYVSEAFVRYKTMDIMVNKNAIPENIKSKIDW